MLREFFDYEKAKEVLLFIVSHISPNKNSTKGYLKTLFFADKLHLERYGRTICGDLLCAMEEGPVPSSFYDMIKEIEGKDQFDLRFKEDESLKTDFVRQSANRIGAHRKYDLNFLSKTDVECLEEALEHMRVNSWPKIKDEVHEEPAYKAAWDNRGFSWSVPIDKRELLLSCENGKEMLELLADY